MLGRVRSCHLTVKVDMHWPTRETRVVVSYLFVTETDALRLPEYTLYFD